MGSARRRFASADARRRCARNSRSSTVTLEEAKADISGLWALQYLADKGVVPKNQERAFYTTFLASTFRTLRFGFTDSHARGMALQVNSLLDHGAIDSTVRRDIPAQLRQGPKAVAALTREIMTIQATGDYAGPRRCSSAWS